MGTRENKVENHLNYKIRKLGGETRKWVSPGHDGVPDRIVFINGLPPIFVEIKTVNGKRSHAQIREQMRLRRLGATVYTLYGIKDVDMFIENLKCKLRARP